MLSEVNSLYFPKIEENFKGEKDRKQNKLLFSIICHLPCVQSYFREKGQNEGYF